ncbi:hypothetical protein LSH36_151g01049 [Paralvinella palmiformis]|uniref:Uncharacterized protein n=1 Tax=Paralvinella palmiformis TaxID=53620 RepID=A0AAD9N717_9ANNE|nr:hypothetical protein LSH36_151g01049 [Paralvinella palmiformis]
MSRVFEHLVGNHTVCSRLRSWKTISVSGAT